MTKRKPVRFDDWVTMEAKDGSEFRLPPFTDANTYIDKGYKLNGNDEAFGVPAAEDEKTESE